MPIGKTVGIHCKCIAFPQVHQSTTKNVFNSSVLALLILLGQLPLYRDPISSNAQYTNLLFPVLWPHLCSSSWILEYTPTLMLIPHWLVQLSASPVCSVQCSVDTGIHTKFICPTPATRMSTVFMHFLFCSVLYCYLWPPYFLSYFYYPAGFGMPQKHIWYFPESSDTTWHKLSVVWRLKVSAKTRPQVCWGRILCSQHVLWVSPSPHRAAQQCALWNCGAYEEMWYGKCFEVSYVGGMPSQTRLAFFLL